MTMIDDRSPARPHLTRDEAKEYERIEAIADPETRALEYMLQVDAVLKEALDGSMPPIPLFLRGPTADERMKSWEEFVKKQGYSSQRFFADKERKAIDPSTEKFLAELAASEQAKRTATPDPERETKRTKRAAASGRRQARKAPGTITVQDIAADLKMLPRDARALLRAAKEPKPEIGWAGDEKWAAHIRGILSKAPAKGERKAGEARPPRGKRAKRVPLKPGDMVGSSKSIVKRDMTPPPNPLHTNIIAKKESQNVTQGRTAAQVRSAAKRKAASTHNVKLTDVLKAQGKRGAKVLERLTDAKRTKVAAKRAKAKGKRK